MVHIMGMWGTSRGFSTPSPANNNNRKPRRYTVSEPAKNLYKVPSGDSPYAKAKHVQLIDKDPSKAISLFWAAINSGDRVDSALKDMAVVMKQLDRSDEAIEAIKSFRYLCPHESQEPLDNILLELYKRSERIEDQIRMLEIKVKSIEQGFNFGGKRVKPARSQGKKIYITIEQEYSRLLGNLAWAFMQNNDFKSAEENYRKALSLEPDKNKQCNLAVCLMHMNRITEAKLLLYTIRAPSYKDGVLVEDEPYARSLERATEILTQLELNSPTGYPCHSSRELLTPWSFQTQPKRCSGSINGEDRKRPLLRNDGQCARKLAFGENIDVLRENGVNNGENVVKDNGDYFLTPKSQKSWADMVQRQPCGRFKNENVDSNIMIVPPLNEEGVSRGNLSLVSSMVNFVEDERVDEYCDFGNGTKMLKNSSKRLQVFKDITSSSEIRRGI